MPADWGYPFHSSTNLKSERLFMKHTSTLRRPQARFLARTHVCACKLRVYWPVAGKAGNEPPTKNIEMNRYGKTTPMNPNIVLFADSSYCTFGLSGNIKRTTPLSWDSWPLCAHSCTTGASPNPPATWPGHRLVTRKLKRLP